jgi:hypothetical protein
VAGALDLGPGGQGEPQPGQLHLGLLLEPVREGGDRLARGAERDLPGVASGRSRLQPARLPEGCLLQRFTDRELPGSVPARAGRRAGLREVEADQLGSGAGRDRGRDDRRGGGVGDGVDRPRSRDHEHRLRSGYGGRAPLHGCHGLDGAGLVGRRGRHADGGGADLGDVQLRGDLGRLVPFRLHRGVGGKSGLHTDARGALHARGALSGGEARGGGAGLQRDRHTRRPVGGSPFRDRCGPGAGPGPGDRVGRPLRRGLRARADGPALPDSRGHGSFSPRVGSALRRRGGPALLLGRVVGGASGRAGLRGPRGSEARLGQGGAGARGALRGGARGGREGGCAGR